jgi:predicted nuclease of predicted toxin-antitoxin system
MKLLLDENLSRRLVPFLQNAYPGSSQVVLLGMESASDRDIWRTAKENDFVVVTRDADFEELSVVLGQPPKIIWLKVKNQTRAAILKILIDNPQVAGSSPARGAKYMKKAALGLFFLGVKKSVSPSFYFDVCSRKVSTCFAIFTHPNVSQLFHAFVLSCYHAA